MLLLLLLSCRSERVTTTADDLGRHVAIPARIDRVISLAPSLTEIVYAVGGEAKLVGTDDFSDTPAAARALPKVGGVQPNAERIVALRPDLVLASASANTTAMAPALAAANVPLFVIRTDRLAEIETAMQRVADLLDAPREREALDALRRSLDAQRRTRAAKPRVLFIAWASPLFIGGRDTFADDLMQLTGSDNAVQVTGWPQYSVEAVAAAPPDVIVHPNRDVTREGVASLVASLPNLRNATIAAVDESLFSRPGPRVGQAAAQLNEVLDRWAQRAAR